MSDDVAAPSPAVEANHRLTRVTGTVLLPLLGLVFLTGLAMDAYWHAHYVVGFVLIPVVLLKLASTGWRALRYYTGSPVYRAAGPPLLSLRLLAPLLVAAISVALVSGVVLLFQHSRTGSVATIHTDSAVISGGLLGLHLLAYLGASLRSAAAELQRRAPRGRALRLTLVLLALVAGAGLAVVTYSEGTWPARSRFERHDDGMVVTTPPAALPA